MRICAVDIETYHSATHSVSRGKLKDLSYIYAMHPQTEIICCGFVWDDGETNCILGEGAIRDYIKSVDWSDTLVVGHNMAEFDSIFLRWRLGMDPAMWGCTLAMARPRLAKSVGLSLDNLSKHFGLGGKTSDILASTEGKNLADFTTDELDEMISYNVRDCQLCLDVFKELMKAGLSSKVELCVIDATVRMMTDPQMELDIARLDQALDDERDRREQALQSLARKVGGSWTTAELEKTLRSANKFAELLKGLGVSSIPTKPSPTNPAKTTWAFAKTDEAFRDLAADANPAVAEACTMKMHLGSDMLESRAGRLKDAQAACPWERLPVLLRACGADTTWRWSAWGKTNMQNTPRINGTESDALRKAIRAPAGQELVVVDATAIELRINHTLWKEPSSMHLFMADPAGADIYRAFAASALYNKSADDVTPDERRVGKVAQLQLGYQSGYVTLCAQARQQGVDMSLTEALSVTNAWRGAYPNIVAGWATCHDALRRMAAGEGNIPLDTWGLCHGHPEGVSTPGGFIAYPSLKRVWRDGREQFVYWDGKMWVNIYGGKVVANIVQHLARQIFVGYVLAIKARLGKYPAALVHDEVLAAYQKEKAEEALNSTLDIMRQAPPWWPELVLWAEGGRGQVYGDIK